MWDSDPLPAEAYVIFPGLAFAFAIKPLTSVTPKAGCADTTFGTEARLLIGVKSFKAS
jgi:hypothetical protein